MAQPAVASLATDRAYSLAYQTAQLLAYLDLEECTGARAYDAVSRGRQGGTFAQLVPQVRGGATLSPRGRVLTE